MIKTSEKISFDELYYIDYDLWFNILIQSGRWFMEMEKDILANVLTETIIDEYNLATVI